jgi:protein-L-isoaspartate(D-aspartate) O-methyltransferase
MSGRAALIVAALLLAASGALAQTGDRSADRQAMVETIRSLAGSIPVGERRGIAEPVLKVMAKVRRHAFVPRKAQGEAYADRPLPIGYGQTISQPYIVALMTDLLELGPDDVALELGTGSGYQAAVLAELAQAVYSIEIVKPLASEAAARLRRLGYDNAEVKQGDGYFGWPEHGPFDAIVVTAAASHVPPPLVEQLKPGGRMVIPVGAAFQVQYLMLVQKAADGTVTTESLLPVRFVPLTGGH